MNAPSRSCRISASFLLGTVLAMAAETPPRLAMKVSDQQATLTLEGTAATAYEIQYADALSSPLQWHSLTNLVLGDASAVIPHARGMQAQRFFRAVVVAREPVIPDAVNWVWIRPGSFWMGSPATEAGRRTDEGPQTHVTITRGFYMGKCEVRQSEFVAVMGYNPSQHVGDLNRPVENLNYLEATEYCRRLTVRERAEGRLPKGWAYRLPTEAEWEYACRAGTSTRFSFGDDPTYVLLRSFEWCAANSNQKPRPVGTKEPNPWGLYDMQGNVREWCADYRKGNLPGGAVSDPKGPASGNQRTVKGGSTGFTDFARDRAAARDGAAESSIGPLRGFRMVIGSEI